MGNISLVLNVHHIIRLLLRRWFEKSLYDLIRGLRNHKGNEKEYIQNSLRECRKEIKGSDMDLKAIALLKLIYLEMFGHDMSWASFHVLEVMSSQKYPQKRVGYLAAVQSFRPDTEVLMLATNLLKKDVSAAQVNTLSLPLIALPHVVNPSLAISLSSDLLPRLSHSNPSVRKKTVAATYRLALVHPETLRVAWPKIKDMLMDEEENSSVTAAVVNVVCELGWRRPRDFLSLAPRLFELLVDGRNNWMAIKIIKLFATLTPLEPRLIKKLLPPLTNLIRTTPAMSLLYECIDGVIQGGVLEGSDGVREGEEIALLCVQKLRSMIIVDGDPNLKYVSLLAFTKILDSHPHLISTQEDVILSCIDDQDISIRMQALQLGAGMVNAENLVTLVERLIQQLRIAPSSDSVANGQGRQSIAVEPAADSDGEDPEEALRSPKDTAGPMLALPVDYRIMVIRQILFMCSFDTYARIVDFEWYIDTLMQLVILVPMGPLDPDTISNSLDTDDVSVSIGRELRSVAVRVNTVRATAVRSCESLLRAYRNVGAPEVPNNISSGVLQYAAWVVGEYAPSCVDPYNTLSSLLQTNLHTLPADAICAYVQAVPKVFARIVSQHTSSWDPERRTATRLSMSRIIDFLEPLSTHPNLEVQERTVEFLELMKISAQALTSDASNEEQTPLLLTRAIPELFQGFELNPVAPSAQRKVPIPSGLDLDAPINPNLQRILLSADYDDQPDPESSEFHSFYNEKEAPKVVSGPAIDSLPSVDLPQSYQKNSDGLLHPEELVRRRLERRDRNKDDPFYIGGEDVSSGTSTPFHDILRASNGEALDVDSIPIMSLELGDKLQSRSQSDAETKKATRHRPRKVHVAKDETFGGDGETSESMAEGSAASLNKKAPRPMGHSKRRLLQVDSSNLGSISLDESDDQSKSTKVGSGYEDMEMAKALAEVERLRLEMQRASERVQASDGAPAEGTLVKKKKKKKRVTPADGNGQDVDPAVGQKVPDVDAPVATKKKKKKKKVVVPDILMNDGNADEEAHYQG